MKTLVLCVDRDDDLGAKAGVVTPVVGRADVLKATIALGLEDPEDSDTNSMFAAIRLHDDLVNKDQDVDIAAIAGDRKVGLESDQIIASQLERVIRETKPTSVILVSDGAEDEFVLPIIQSRVKVDSVQRVIVKQEKTLEGTYYIITKALQDEKIQRKIVVPFALVCLVYSLLYFLGYGYIAWPGIIFTLGMYFMIRVFHWEGPLSSAASDIVTAMRSSPYIEIIFGMVAGILIIWGIFIEGWYRGWNTLDVPDLDSTIFVLTLIDRALWWIIAGLLVYTIGRTVDIAVRKGKFIRSAFPIMLALFAAGFMMEATLILLNHHFMGTSLEIDHLFIWMLMGGLLSFLAYLLYGYMQTQASRSVRRRSWSI